MAIDFLYGALAMFIPYFFMMGIDIFREADDPITVWIAPAVIAWIITIAGYVLIMLGRGEL